MFEEEEEEEMGPLARLKEERASVGTGEEEMEPLARLKEERASVGDGGGDEGSEGEWEDEDEGSSADSGAQAELSARGTGRSTPLHPSAGRGGGISSLHSLPSPRSMLSASRDDDEPSFQFSADTHVTSADFFMTEPEMRTPTPAFGLTTLSPEVLTTPANKPSGPPPTTILMATNCPITVDIEDLASICRCGQSRQFPYCDQSSCTTFNAMHGCKIEPWVAKRDLLGSTVMVCGCGKSVRRKEADIPLCDHSCKVGDICPAAVNAADVKRVATQLAGSAEQRELIASATAGKTQSPRVDGTPRKIVAPAGIAARNRSGSIIAASPPVSPSPSGERSVAAVAVASPAPQQKPEPTVFSAAPAIYTTKSQSPRAVKVVDMVGSGVPSDEDDDDEGESEEESEEDSDKFESAAFAREVVPVRRVSHAPAKESPQPSAAAHSARRTQQEEEEEEEKEKRAAAAAARQRALEKEEEDAQRQRDQERQRRLQQQQQQQQLEEEDAQRRKEEERRGYEQKMREQEAKMSERAARERARDQREREEDALREQAAAAERERKRRFKEEQRERQALQRREDEARYAAAALAPVEWKGPARDGDEELFDSTEEPPLYLPWEDAYRPKPVGAEVLYCTRWDPVSLSALFVVESKELAGVRIVHGKPPGGVLAGTRIEHLPVLHTSQGRVVVGTQNILRHLLERYPSAGPSFSSRLPQVRSTTGSITNIVELSLLPLLYMYPSHTIIAISGKPPIPMRSAEKEQVFREHLKQLDVLEELASRNGPYLTGNSVTTADAVLFPLFLFYERYFHRLKKVLWNGRPKLQAWWGEMCEDKVAKVLMANAHQEILKILNDDSK